MSEILYKPFSAEEVATICQVKANVLDGLMEDVLPIHRDRERRLGLDYMGLLAVYASKRWTEEGSGPTRAGAVLYFVMRMPLTVLEHNFRQGNTFPAPREQLLANGVDVPEGVLGVMVKPPPGRLGNTLNLKVLRGELDDRLSRLYPKGWENR